MANGDKRICRFQHWEVGCCVNDHGIVTREQQVRNFVSAFVGAGFFGGTLWTSPSKARWLSTSLILGVLLAGMLFHSALPRVWRMAFGEWHIPRSIDDSDDFHNYVKSKIYRAKLWLSNEHTSWRSAVIAWVTSSVEHLMLLLQSLDEKGGLLRQLVLDPADPISIALRDLSQFILAPMDTSLKHLLLYFSTMGVPFITIVSQFAR